MLDFYETIWRQARIATIDVETTGLDPMIDRVIEIAVVVSDGDKVVDRWSSLVNPGFPIPMEASSVNGITNEMVSRAPYFGEVIATIAGFVDGCLPSAYNAKFDRSFISSEWLRECHDIIPTWLRSSVEWIDPLVWIRVAQRYEKSKKLTDVCERMGIVLEGAHRATADAEAALMVLYKLSTYDTLAMPDTYGDLIEKQRLYAANNDADYHRWLQKQPPERRLKG